MKRFIAYSFFLGFLFSALCLSAQCTLTATSSGGNTGYSQVYILVDASGNIVADNTTGIFTNVAPGTYTIHALNYDPFNAPMPLPSVLAGQPLSNVGSAVTGCFNADLLTDFVYRSCGSCQQTITQCETDPLVTSSPGGNTAYTQVYVLSNSSTGLIVAVNTTGVFTGMLTAGNSYRVYALNYNPANPPAPLPVSGQPVSNTATVNTGCFNADFFSDYICLNITSCATSCVQNNDVCENTPINATAPGFNSSYTQVYVLTDYAGNFIAQNSSGTFATTGFFIGDIYHVHALNYDPANPPSPLPSALSLGSALSTITGGCFNADFLTDYVCYTVISCSPSCFQEINVCENEDIVVSSPGSMIGYVQVYVLTDDLGAFVAQNSTGVFSTTGFTSGDTYHVHALNYDLANPPAPLPSSLASGASISTISGGCFNSDFLTDYLCYTIGCPCSGKLVQYAPDQYVPGNSGSVNYTVATAYCDDIFGWRYYFDPSEPDDLLFAIEHMPAGGNSNTFTARVTLGVNDYSTTTGYDVPVLGQDYLNFEANFGMGRYWDVDVLTGSLNGNVNVRFYYKPAEYNTASAAASVWRSVNEPAAQSAGYDGLLQLAPFWFKTNDATAYSPVPDLFPTDVNNGNVLQLFPNFIGSNANLVTNNKNYVQFNNQISSFSGGTVTFRVVPDPLLLSTELLSFEGKKEGADNFLYWSVDNEINVQSFVLERSGDGIASEEIFSAPVSGNLNYSFLDSEPHKLSYYRLKMIRNDGSYDFSDWIVIDRGLTESNVIIYPNPTKGELILNFVAENLNDLQLVITDVLGRKIASQTFETQLGVNRQYIDLSELPAAVYVLTVGYGNQKIIRKITKI
jgi:hypothetical protein